MNHQTHLRWLFNQLKLVMFFVNVIKFSGYLAEEEWQMFTWHWIQKQIKEL